MHYQSKSGLPFPTEDSKAEEIAAFVKSETSSISGKAQAAIYGIFRKQHADESPYVSYLRLLDHVAEVLDMPTSRTLLETYEGKDTREG